MNSQLTNINNTLDNHDIDAEVKRVIDEIHKIPQSVTDGSADVTDRKFDPSPILTVLTTCAFTCSSISDHSNV